MDNFSFCVSRHVIVHNIIKVRLFALICEFSDFIYSLGDQS